jgi:hypothetical protein
MKNIALRLSVALAAMLLALSLGSCLSQGDAAERALTRSITTKVHVFNPESPWADVLIGCSVIQTADQSCTFRTLPPMGWPDLQIPTVDDIMDRVIVSHDWMGERFRDLLEMMPEDVLYLMRSLAIIGISADVRPSFYSSWRAAMFIDPNYLWLTPEERNTMDLSPDFRSDYGRDLNFEMPWRYVIDNDYAFSIPSVTATEVDPRELDELFLPLARLLYHELAHAVDYLEPARLTRIPEGRRMAFVVSPTVSGALTAAMPLESNEMVSLARVRFHGDTATSTQRNYVPADVAGFFAPDHATHWYNYSTVREDQAMLFETAMSLFHFGMESDTAVTNAPQPGDTSADLIVEWGARNRIGDEVIRERLRLLMPLMLPEFSFDTWIDGLDPPIPLRSGESWHANLDPYGLSPETEPSKLQEGRDFSEPHFD